MLYFAYDGSLGGDWIARYTIRFAAHDLDHTVNLLHVDDGSLPAAQLKVKLDHLDRECRAQGVELFPQLLQPRGDVATTLRAALPDGSEHLLVCGTRLRSRSQSYLSGTVTERLLRQSRLPILALRVVQPGLLGAPRKLLLPLENSRERAPLAALRPLLQRLLPVSEQVHLLHAIILSTFRQQHYPAPQLQALRDAGVTELARAGDELRRIRGGAGLHIDGNLVLCNDWTREIVLHASRFKSDLIVLGYADTPAPLRWLFGHRLEPLLRAAPCDVALFSAP